MNLFYGYEKEDANTKLSLSGGTMEGDINMNLRSLRGLAAPVGDQDAISKIYLDTYYVRKTKNVKFFRIWEYLALKIATFNYPHNVRSGYPTCPVIYDVNDQTEIEIVGLFSDNDGGGLDSNDVIEFEISYVLDNGTNRKKTIFTENLSQYGKYSTSDGKQTTNNFKFDKKIKFKDIHPDFNKIKIFNVGIRQPVGTIRGNESRVIVNVLDF